MNARTSNLILTIIGFQGTIALVGALWLLANHVEVPTVIWINSSTTIAGLLGLFQHRPSDKTSIGDDATINVGDPVDPAKQPDWKK